MFAICLLYFFSAQCFANSRDNTIKLLENLPNNWVDANFKAWVGQADAESVRIGDNLVFSFLSERDAQIFLVFVDSAGIISVIFPDEYSTAKYPVNAGKIQSFPAKEDNFPIEAQAPVGLENIFVFATNTAIDRDFLDNYPDDIPTEKSKEFIQDLKMALAKTSSVAVTNIQQRLIGRTDDVEYTSDDIVAFFETRSRSYSRPRLPMHIEFESGSHQLTPQATKNLDLVAEALKSGLSDKNFQIGGHTDNIGSIEYNAYLSQRRADTTKKYLLDQGVAAQLLVSKGFGEHKPIEENSTPEGRHANRRVEFQLDN